MKKTVKLLSLSLALVMLVFVFASCGKVTVETCKENLESAGYELDLLNETALNFQNQVFIQLGYEGKLVDGFMAKKDSTKVSVFEWEEEQHAKKYADDLLAKGGSCERKGSIVIIATQAGIDAALGK